MSDCPPIAQFSASPLTGKRPLTVQFTDESADFLESWLWDFGDGETSTNQNPSHTYSSAGVYTVSLTGTNAGGTDTKTIINMITVKESNPATIALGSLPATGKIVVSYYLGDARITCHRYAEGD